MKKLVAFTLLLTTISVQSQVLREQLLKKTGILNKENNTPNTSDSTAKKEEVKSGPSIGFGLASRKDLQDDYLFQHNVLVEVQNYKKSGEKDGDPSNIRYHFGGQDILGMEMTQVDKKGKSTTTFGITDFSKNHIASLINQEGEKTGSVLKFNVDKAVEKHADTSDVKIVKTGRTKTILGYLCEEYIITDKDGNKTETWMTTALPFDMTKMYTGGRKKPAYMENAPNGFMMEMTYTTEKGEKSTWIVKEVNLNKSMTIHTDDYKFSY